MSGDDATPESSDTVLVPTPGLATAAVPAAEHVLARLHALVIGEKHVASYPLPDSGTITVGRSVTATAVFKASITVSIWLPSMVCVCQPKAANLSAIGV